MSEVKDENSTKLRELVKQTEGDFVRKLNSIVSEEMKDNPDLAGFVTRAMDQALTTPERALIADTAIVVYKAALLESSITEKHHPGGSLWPVIYVAEDIVEEETEGDNNAVYRLLPEIMGEDSELARYVAARMHESINLEGASLVGKTSLIIYKTLRTNWETYEVI